MDDSLAVVPAQVTASQFGLQARIEAPTKAKQGDTLDIVVHVTWTSAPHAWLVLPQNSPECAQLVQVSLATEQTRTVSAGKETPEIRMHYRMLAKDTGTAQIPALHYEIPVQSGALQLATEPASLQVGAATNILSWVLLAVGLLALNAGLLFWLRVRRAKRGLVQRESAARRKLRADFETLAGRVNAADPRAWMIELESLYAMVPRSEVSAEQTEARKKLEELFAQSRYGGGPRDQWELHEWIRIARTALDLKRTEEDNG